MDPPASLPSLPPPPAVGACWSQVLKKTLPPTPAEPISSSVFGTCNSSKGISVAVVDANAIIHGDKLINVADKFVTVAEALDEVRDPVSRQRIAFLPIHVETMEPSADAAKKVVKFARETGDLQTLSDVDLKLIALAYTLEAQIHGTGHLRESPPPLRMVNVRNLPEADMPGWGSNVPNLVEWEALELATEGDNDLNNSSKILPLKDINFNVVPMDGNVSNSGETKDEDHIPQRYIWYNRPKKEIKVEGKQMVDGVDASQGDHGDDLDDWRPAVSRSTHRRYLRRKARREMFDVSEKLSEPDLEGSTNASIVENCDLLSDAGSECADALVCKSPVEVNKIPNEVVPGENFEEYDLPTKLRQMELEPNSSQYLEGKQHETCSSSLEKADSPMVDAALENADISIEGDEIEMCAREFNQLEITSQTDESVDVSRTDDNSSEQSWALRSFSESSVASVTSDFAMQNVILQIGLRLLAPGGMQIHQLHRWVLKCHACNKVTAEIGRIFCPKCGNGGTLRKVSVTVGENGVILAARRPRVTLRGTKFSLPLPQGGRDGITKNLILREDQIPRKYLYPNSKKKNKKQDKDFFTADDIFTHAGNKKAPLKPPVGKAVSLFFGKRNPNDNHYSRPKC